MPSAPCLPWEYGSHIDRAKLLPAAAAKVLTGIQAGTYAVEIFARDMRPIHLELFTGLTPHGFDYYAGNYRGSHHRCLRSYEVEIRTDLMVGTKAIGVQGEVNRLGMSIVRNVEAIEQAFQILSRPMTPIQRTVVVVRLACSAFVSYLTVHPFADGNGHTARALLWLLLFRFGYVPSGWTIEPRPGIPDYGQLISQHRRGQRDALEQYVLRRISLAKPLPN